MLVCVMFFSCHRRWRRVCRRWSRKTSCAVSCARNTTGSPRSSPASTPSARTVWTATSAPLAPPTIPPTAATAAAESSPARYAIPSLDYLRRGPTACRLISSWAVYRISSCHKAWRKNCVITVRLKWGSFAASIAHTIYVATAESRTIGWKSPKVTSWWPSRSCRVESIKMSCGPIKVSSAKSTRNLFSSFA